jgi:hypothetical protein
MLKPIIRVAKVGAVAYEEVTPGRYQYYAYLDGGHKVPISDDTAEYLSAVIDTANTSDTTFFSRGG